MNIVPSSDYVHYVCTMQLFVKSKLNGFQYDSIGCFVYHGIFQYTLRCTLYTLSGFLTTDNVIIVQKGEHLLLFSSQIVYYFC